jgi:hypothetical protein
MRPQIRALSLEPWQIYAGIHTGKPTHVGAEKMGALERICSTVAETLGERRHAA